MYQVIIVIHVLLGLGIIGLILMQQGKGADAGAAFGTGSAGSVLVLRAQRHFCLELQRLWQLCFL